MQYPASPTERLRVAGKSLVIPRAKRYYSLFGNLSWLKIEITEREANKKIDILRQGLPTTTCAQARGPILHFGHAPNRRELTNE